MRPASAALVAYLADPLNRGAVQVDLFTIILAGGDAYRFSSWPAALTVPGAGFPSGSYNAGSGRTFLVGPRFGRSKVSTKIGVEPAELDIDVFAAPADLLGGTPFAQAAGEGQLDGATVELDRLFAPPQADGGGNLDTSLGVLVWFYGRVADVDVGRSRVQLKVKSLLNLLALQQMPRRIFSSGCSHVFGDAMCGYDRTAGKNALGASTGLGLVSLTAASGSDVSHLVTGFSPSVATAYDNGTITCTAGANLGASRTISTVIGGTVYLVRNFLSPVAIGDTFAAIPGCDHTLDTCDTAFLNLDRYGGFPYIPPPEVAV